MNFIELLFLAVGLSMDAFAASICKGLTVCGGTFKKSLKAGLWFGGFQALMPIVGWLLGSRFCGYIAGFDHWIAFGLLVLIGGNTLREAFSGKEETVSCDMSFMTMFTLAVATSIDALAAGVTFAFLDVSAIPASLFIGAVTFVFSAVGIRIGGVFGEKYRKPAEICGGMALVILGVKILLEHLNIFTF